MVVTVLSLVDACNTAHQGAVVYDALNNALARHQIVSLDFSGVPNVTSSFVNTALLPLLADFSFSELKIRLKISGTNRQIANMIRDRLGKESEKRSVAA
ncbi:STAS-like domain-containing protein [Mameliella alba]|nr:STAS-like domain-containing protein [Mameliella alba]MBY6172602.1 STAS-like domain-containing protein [Mameliella alba]MBY6177584.1 STAS-like domain-containing protein [Mameliella alba]